MSPSTSQFAAPTHTDAPPSAGAAAPPLVSLEPGCLWVAEEYRRVLQRAGLDTIRAMMGTTDGRLLRALPERENWRLELHDAHSRPRGAYLKKHHTRTWRQWLRARWGAGPGQTPGRTEALNVALLTEAGIAAMPLIAFGELLHPSGLLESFVLTEELTGYEQLDKYLRLRFPPRSNQPSIGRDRALPKLIRQVAGVARHFHGLGFNHRDLYCCHFFISEPSTGRFLVNLIDLQRVEHRKFFRTRWLVKDLAQLAYSAPRDRISCTDRMRFIKQYLGVSKLGPKEKWLVRRVLAKQRRMERHLGVHP